MEINLEKISKKNFISLNEAFDSIKEILNFAGIKSKSVNFYSLEKEILISPGRTIYAIHIDDFYNDELKKIYKVKFQIDFCFSNTIKSLIKEKDDIVFENNMKELLQ